MSHTAPQSATSLKVCSALEHSVLLDVGDAVGPVLLLRVQVSMRERHQPPAHGKEQPAADKGGGEDDEGEAPLQVHQRGEHVLQEAALLADVLVRQVARTVLGDEARLVDAVPEHRLSGHAGDEPRQAEFLRDDAFSGQHPVDDDDDGAKSKVSVRLRCVFTRGWRGSTCRGSLTGAQTGLCTASVQLLGGLGQSPGSF